MAAADSADHLVEVSEDHDGDRLDHFISATLNGVSRAQAQRLIDAGHVTLDGALVKAARKVREGNQVAVHIPAPVSVIAEPEDIAIDIVFEDSHLVVVNKAAGMVVHPAPGHPSGTLVNALLHHCTDLSGIGGELRPGIVHRIDKDTSGILAVTKDDATHQAMAALFHDKVPRREYLAVVSPAPSKDSGTIESLYGRHPVARKKFSSKVQSGKNAVTHWDIEERLEGAAVIRCRLETGRTHQIRVHMADAGWPLIGDPVYGRRYRGELGELAKALGRQALHAQSLAFAHPITKAELAFTAPIPADIDRLLAALRPTG